MSKNGGNGWGAFCEVARVRIDQVFFPLYLPGWMNTLPQTDIQAVESFHVG